MNTRMFFIALTAALAACDRLPKSAPMIINADGNTQVACSGNVWVKSSDAGYEIDFTDNDGLGHTIYGVKKLSLSDVPKLMTAPMPDPLPPLYDYGNDHSLPKYGDGQTIQNGAVVTWTQSHSQARFVVEYAGGTETGRHWAPVWIPNTVCMPTPTI